MALLMKLGYVGRRAGYLPRKPNDHSLNRVSFRNGEYDILADALSSCCASRLWSNAIRPRRYARRRAVWILKFESFSDINKVGTLKAVWDFYFEDPKTVGIALNNVVALMKATSQFGPTSFDPVKIVVVSHGPEVVVWDRKNYAKY